MWKIYTIVCYESIWIIKVFTDNSPIRMTNTIFVGRTGFSQKLIFITNRFDLATSTICALYKARWKVELFFKTLKQNLKVKKFLGTSANAVKAQILVALIAYVLIQLVRWLTKSKVSIPDAMAAIGTLLLLREPLARLLGDLPRVTRHPRPLQLVLNL